MDLLRLRVDLSGAGVVGPSVQTWYADSLTGLGMNAAVKALLTSLANNFPDDLTFTIPSAGDTIESTTGDLTGTWAASGGGTVTGTDSGAFALGSGYRLRWLTDGIVGGRRVRGTTFMVPCAGLMFSTSGRLVAASVTSINTAVSTFAGTMAGKHYVWSRPVPAHVKDGVSIPKRDGAASVVTGWNVPTTPTSLRSRRI